MIPFRGATDDEQPWATIPVVSVRMWHAFGAWLSLAVATVGLLAMLATHEVDRDALLYYLTTVVAIIAVWGVLRRTRPRLSLYAWPLGVLGGLAGASAVAPEAASLCAATIVLGFLYAGLTQRRGASLVLVAPAGVVYGVVYRALPTEQLLVKLAITACVWIAATEMPTWLTARLRHARAELARLAATDPLTLLANRRYWDQRLEAMIAGGEDSAVLLVDLDHFKRFNDEHGHLAGDRMLVDFAAIIAAATPSDGLAARWGGEEFAVVLRDAARARQVAEAIRRAVPLAQTCSIGLVAHRSGESLTELMRRADEALYRAKSSGRDRVVAA